MKTRILVGTALVAVLVGVYWLDAHVLERAVASRVLLWAMTVVAFYEGAALLARKTETLPGFGLYGGIALVAIVVPNLIAGVPVPGAMIGLAAVIGAAIRLLGMAPTHGAETAFPDAARWAAMFAWLVGLMSLLDRIVLDDVTRAFAVLAVSKTSDICGYFVGVTMGRKRIAPALSPKKSWEGSIAGVLGSAGVAALLTAELVGQGPPAYAALLGALIGIASLLGDLSESGFKRWAGAKDSSLLLPEFGGVLDMLDGILLAVPVAYICLLGS